MQVMDFELVENDIREAISMPLAEAIAYKEKIPKEDVRRFKFHDERAFVKFVHTLKRALGFKVSLDSSNYYIVHGEDDYGDVIAMFRGRKFQSMFVELAFEKLGIPLKEYPGEYLLDLLKI